MYVPSFLLTLTAYGSLFLPPVSINARGGMSLITLINIFKLNEGIRRNIPKVAYTTFLDIWLIVCLFVPFSFTIVQTAIECYRESDNEKSPEKWAVPSPTIQVASLE